MRLHLTLALITIIALVFTLRAARKHHFGFSEVDAIARHRATTTFTAPADPVPPQLRKLKPELEAGINAKENARLWRKKGLPFQIDFYPQLYSNPSPHFAPSLSWVDSKGPHVIPYSNAFFNFLDKTVKPPRPLVFDPPLPPDMGYAGFYVRYPDMAIGSNPGSLDGFFSAFGASYFRAIAKDQDYGLSARGIAINSGYDNIPEEFPLFTDWWLHEPSSTSTELVLDALMDGPSVTGAYEFKIHPGAVTSVDIHASLYFRKAVQRLGLTPFSSMYLYGENSYDHFGDSVHPEVHDSDGLLIQDNHDEWSWRPLAQSDDKRTEAPGYQLQDYEIPEENPKGYGLLQRDRDFTHYQDPAFLYNVRPSAFVIPHGDWGKGHIDLLQRPSNDFNTDNVVLFWNPEKPIKAGNHLEINYTIDFYMNDAARPPLAYVKQTLINCPAPDAPPPPPAPAAPTPPPKPGAPTTNAPAAQAPTTNSVAATPPKSGAPSVPLPPPVIMGPPTPTGPPIPKDTKSVQFVLDFIGNGIENIPANQPPEIDLKYGPPGTYLREKTVEKIAYEHCWRVTFTIIPFKLNVPTDLTCRLMRDGKPLTETWTYTWRQGKKIP